MAPALYRYPDDPNPAVQAFTAKYRKMFGIDVNYLGEAGYTCATFTLAVLEKAGRDLTLDSFINAMESMKDWHDIFGGPAAVAEPDQSSRVQPIVPVRGEEHALDPVTDAPLSF